MGKSRVSLIIENDKIIKYEYFLFWMKLKMVRCYKRNTTLTFLKVAVLIIAMVVLGMCTFALPPLAGYTAEMYPEFAFLKYPILIGLYFTVIPFFFALYEFYKLLNVIRNKNAFSELAIISLRHIMICAIIITVLYIIGFLIMEILNA